MSKTIELEHINVMTIEVIEHSMIDLMCAEHVKRVEWPTA